MPKAIPPQKNPDNASLSAVADSNSSLPNATQAPAQAASSVASYVTLTCCLVSALGLVVVIVVFSAVPSLRNTGGLLTMSLASSLLVGLLCFLVGPLVRKFAAACRVIAVVMFYAYLSSFAWMSLFALDVAKTFAASGGARGAVGGGSAVRRYGKLAVAGWLLPLLVALAAAAVDAVWPHSAVSARFGRGQCYFNAGYALLAWFYVPVAISVVANVALSVAVIVMVWRTTRQTRSARDSGSSTQQLIVMSLKVTAIFGVTWLLGVMAALIDNEALSEAAGIVNSLQGILVSLSFLLSSRTIRAVRTRMGGGQASNQATTRTSVRSGDQK